jgi:hypothetical protein
MVQLAHLCKKPCDDRLIVDVDSLMGHGGGSEVSPSGDVFEYVTAALKGDEFAHLAMVGKMVMLDDPEPISSEEALKTLDAEHLKGE